MPVNGFVGTTSARNAKGDGYTILCPFPPRDCYQQLRSGGKVFVLSQRVFSSFFGCAKLQMTTLADSM